MFCRMSTTESRVQPGGQINHGSQEVVVVARGDGVSHLMEDSPGPRRSLDDNGSRRWVVLAPNPTVQSIHNNYGNWLHVQVFDEEID